eukprot:TRINITY_DN362_c0_g1_i2.p1 TRINITY_DN362_c0_g1~~TRINITY_DN362_c0_g1_i2.p1  ORF type:complete len:177 (-),score=47.21 TRINITY_DN362_c0_g1_i2:186-716(-)
MSYNKNEFIQTKTGNKISRKSILGGSKHISMNGKGIIMPGAILRGDLAKLSIGVNVVIKDNVVLHPPYKLFKGSIAFFTLNIGNYVIIEEDAIVSAASIGSYVEIGKGAIIGKRCILKDCCKIADYAVVPDDTVVPPFCIVEGYPATINQESLPECYQEIVTEKVEEFYSDFSDNV